MKVLHKKSLYTSKIFQIILLILTLFLFTSCESIQNNDDTFTLPDLTGMSRTEISEILDKQDINYIFQFSQVPCYNESYYDKFVAYGNGMNAGDEVKKNTQIRIKTTPLHLNIDHLSEVTLDVDYQNKSFIDDGIGIVKLVRCVDGDTARFIDPLSKTESRDFSVRFLGIDTPESTIDNDPWGKAASNFTKEKLTNAKEIVLEAEGARTETYGRYLAFVWVDGVLLNLWIVQEAYSNSTLSGKSKYFEIMNKTSFEAMATGRRFFGERDLSYNYD